MCPTPTSPNGDAAVGGPVVFRGNPELFTGRLMLETDPRGVGAFQLSVDLEGGHQDLFAGRLDWQGTFLRRLHVEIDGQRRSARRITCFRPDQTSVTAQTFVSTRPVGT